MPPILCIDPIPFNLFIRNDTQLLPSSVPCATKQIYLLQKYPITINNKQLVQHLVCSHWDVCLFLTCNNSAINRQQSVTCWPSHLVVKVTRWQLKQSPQSLNMWPLLWCRASACFLLKLDKPGVIFHKNVTLTHSSLLNISFLNHGL